MKHLVIPIVLLCLSSNVSAQTLHEYLREAGENNPELKANYALFQASLSKIDQVGSLPNPKLSYGYFISPVETRLGAQQAKIGLSQMFPWFGTLQAKSDAASWHAEAQYHVFINARNKLFYRVKSAYYPLLELNEIIRVQQRNLQILQSYKRLATVGFKNGKESMANVIRVDIMIEGVESELQILLDKKVPLETQFNLLLNRKSNASVQFGDSLLSITVKKIYSKDSLLHHPQLEEIELLLQANESMQKVVHKMVLPMIGIGIDYALINEREDMVVPNAGRDVIMPMVQISLPIYRKKNSALKDEVGFKREALEAKKVAILNQLEMNYETSYYKMKRADELLLRYSRQKEKTKQAIRLLTVSYSNSGKDFEEILRVQQQLLKYEMAEAKAWKEYHVALAMIQYLTIQSNDYERP